MLFPFMCGKCGNRFDGDFPIGQAPRTVPCPSCGGSGKRVYAGVSIGVRVAGGRPSTFGEQMKARNGAAEHRMKGRKPPVRVKAYDYGNGDVREV
jgi:predicted nucleic acid-binding Zn ribbon protein